MNAPDEKVDVLVAGSGGGIAGAYTAAREGLSVALVEATDQFGGTFAVFRRGRNVVSRAIPYSFVRAATTPSRRRCATTAASSVTAPPPNCRRPTCAVVQR